MGAWSYIMPRFLKLFMDMGIKYPSIQYAGRAEAASPAAGFMKMHIRQQQHLIEDAFGIKREAEGSTLKKVVG